MNAHIFSRMADSEKKSSVDLPQACVQTQVYQPNKKKNVLNFLDGISRVQRQFLLRLSALFL